jgi:hypothetical protein
MDKPVVRFPIMAVASAAVTLGLCQLTVPHQSGVAWAQEKNQQDKPQEKDTQDKAQEEDEPDKKEETRLGYTARQHQTQTTSGKVTLEMTTMIREDPRYGIRTDGYYGTTLMLSTCSDYAERVTVSLFPGIKRYTCHKWPPYAGIDRKSEDPRPALRKALAGKHKDLGRRTIDGVETAGIEVNDPTGRGANFKIDSIVTRYWSSVETRCPVLVEDTMIGNRGVIQIKTVTDQFRWNVALDPNEFKVKIPPGYIDMASKR